ncbi:MAG: acyl-CoA thioesterase [Chromatiales bacterium]|nr:acyl-CoA thioesterase [Gammaproteobacteria bacterium]MBW6477484.1 acyl-CoA thioesterase [Chromatiales bacterium]
MEGYDFSLEMHVRDYECDIQGIVNNGVYQNYLEHVRHVYLKQIGIDFAELARQGINLVVVRAELDYKLPLTTGDHFVVALKMRRESRLKFAFFQDIYRLPDKRLIMNAKVIGTALNQRGRPELPEALDRMLVD